jgi:hypothetical protein
MMSNPPNTDNPPVFNPSIPIQKNTLARSQLDFLNNFFTLYNAFKANHIALDAVSGAGNHTIIQLLEQPSLNQIQTDIGEISVYTKKITGQTDQIFLRYQGNQTEFPLTNYQIYSLGNNTTQYFTFLPGGLLLYFGRLTVTFSANSNTPVVFKLNPAIAIKIISMNFGSGNAVASFSPWVTLQQPQGGIYSTINLFQSNGNIAPVPNVIFYVVIANVAIT